MSTGKIELSVGTMKIANKYEIFTEEEIDAINNKIPELDERVGVIEDEIDEINSSLDNKAKQSDLEVERNRIDSFTKLAEGSTTGDAELIDGRIGYKGHMFTNIGEAIRTQFRDLNSKFEIGHERLYPTWEVGSINTSPPIGTDVDSKTRIRSNYIKTEVNTKISISDDYEYRIFYYTLENDEFVFQKTPSGAFTNKEITLDTNYQYFRINVRKNDDSQIEVSAGEYVAYIKMFELNIDVAVKNNSLTLKKMNNEVLDLLDYNPLIGVEWELGSINPSNGDLWADTTRIRTIEKIRIKKDTKISFADKNISIYTIVFYNEDGSYKKSVTTIPSYIFTENAYVKIVLKKTGNLDLSDFLPIVDRYVLYSKVDYENIDNSFGDFYFSYPLDCGADIEIVDNKLYSFVGSSDDNTTTVGYVIKYDIDYENKTLNLQGSITHNLGHTNSVSYCEETDTLICGNGSSDYNLSGKIYIIQNFKTLSESAITIDNAIIIDVGMEFGSKVNVIWGEDNNTQFNICYCLTNDGATIRKLLLKKENGIFNGEYIVLKTWNTNSLDVIQGACFYKGKIYCGLGHAGVWACELTLLSDGNVKVRELKEDYYDNNGNIDTKQYVQGISIKNDYLHLGNSNGIKVYKI